MARPHKTSAPLTAKRNFRLTEEEDARLTEIMEERRLGVGDLMRVHVLKLKARRSHRPKATGDRLRLIEALAEQGKIGSNLNQIARACNIGHEPEREEIYRALALLERVSGIIIDELTGEN